MRQRPRAAGWLRLVSALGLGVALVSACGDDPPGPEQLQLIVADTFTLGGAVIELTGDGILGVRGPSGVEVVALPVAADDGKALPRLRVLAILETPGVLTLTVDVAQAGAPLPRATFVQASGSDDALLGPARLPEIRVRR